MRIEKIEAEKDRPSARIYIMAGILKQFKGARDVEVQIIRPNPAPEEFAALENKNLVCPPPPEMPAGLIENSSARQALGCILEAFTEEESEKLARYLAERYGDKFDLLRICPMELPVPFGVAPLADIPESENSGFIRFEKAPDYPLNFAAWAYYDLASQTSSSGM